MNTTTIFDNLKCYLPYFEWNEALRNLFLTKSTEEMIQIHVDDKTLQEIGERHQFVLLPEENYRTQFEKTVVNFCKTFYGTKNLLRVAMDMKKDKLYAVTEDKRIVKSIDNRPKIYEVPYFSIIIYVLINLDNGQTQQWNNVHQTLKLGKGDTLDHCAILPLWEDLHQYNQSFDKDASVYDREDSQRGDYIGRLKFHMPLPSFVRRRIHDAMYKTGIWKLTESKDFGYIISRICSSFRDPNDEAKRIIDNIMHLQFSTNDKTGVSLRKLQSVIDEFDIDDYKKKIEERQRSSEDRKTRICGNFALAVYYPEDNEEEPNSIVLLTTVDQEVSLGKYTIEEGGAGTLAGYNTSLVKYNDSYSVKIEEHSITNSNILIKPLPIDDVVFFYEYDPTLFIQTRDIVPAHSYLIAVRQGKEESFLSWCQDNGNRVHKLSATDEVYGNGWSVFEASNGLTGTFYEQSLVTEEHEYQTDIPDLKGGIEVEKNRYKDRYFINALPYIKLPISIDAKTLSKSNIYFNIDNRPYENYKLIISGQKLIIDIEDIPVLTEEIATCDIALYISNEKILYRSFEICGQSVQYEESDLYKYDRYGRKSDSNEIQFVYCGNHIAKDYMSIQQVRGAYIPQLEEVKAIPTELYCVNLLAACCYHSPTEEIDNEQFRKAISYAATRLGIDIQKAGLVDNVKYTLAKAGIINIDFVSKKYQAIPPSFTKVPFALDRIIGHQLYMLSGCYTRAFFADLMDYCLNKNISLYTPKKKQEVAGEKEQKIERNEDFNDASKLLPPFILLDYKFDAHEFIKEYGHKCDIISDHDMAGSFINIIPQWMQKISASLTFYKTTENELYLKPAKVKFFPRIRQDNNKNTKHYYVERDINEFALIEDKSLKSWFTMYCYSNGNSPMVIICRDQSILLPVSMQLPIYVQRSLFIMNLGLPSTRKVFVCNEQNGTGYYSLMHCYKLYDQERCKRFVEKLTGHSVNDSPLVREAKYPNYKMEYWKSKDKGSRKTDRYLILYQMDLLSRSKSILAIGTANQVFLKSHSDFKKLEVPSLNEAMSFLILGNWRYGHNHNAIGFWKNQGEVFEPKYQFAQETIELPNEDLFEVSPITIV